MGYFLTVCAIFFNNLIGAVSMHMVMSLSGIIFLGIPTVVKISAYALAIAQRSGMPPEQAFLIGMLFAVVAAFFMAWLFAKVSFDSFVVLGLTSILAVEALTRSWDSVTNGVLGISGIARPEFMKELGWYALAVGITAAVVFAVEFVILQTWIGRSMRAYREDQISLESMGIPTKKLGQTVIIVSGLIMAITGFFYVWRVQFLDPAAANVHYLVELLTMAIIALKPQLRYVVLGAIFVVLVPEVLRMFHFPSGIIGHARLLIYSAMLIMLLMKLSKTFVKPRNAV